MTLRKCTTGGDNMVNAGNAASTLVTDYDYFKDPATIGYKNVGDNAQTFVGTENVLEIKSVGGHACLFLNGTQLFDLTETGVVSDVFNNFNSDGGFLCFYGTNASAQAIKKPVCKAVIANPHPEVEKIIAKRRGRIGKYC